MITLYSGTPGSGKSLHTAKVIYNRLRYHRQTISTVNVEVSRVKKARKDDYIYINLREVKPKFLRDFSREYFKKHKYKEGSILLILDECELIFDARKWNEKGRDEWLAFFTNHRKYGYDVLLIAQFDRMIDRYIRSLIEYEVIHRKVSNYGFGGKMLNLFSGCNLFVGVRVWYSMKEKVGTDYFKANRKTRLLYDTNQRYDEE